MMTILIFVGGYFAVLLVLSLAARPCRLRLAGLAEQLHEEWEPEEFRRFVQPLLASAYSIRTAPMYFLFYMAAMLRSGYQLDADANRFVTNHPKIADDPRLHELMDCHLLSAGAVNPLFGTLLFGARWLFRLKALYFYGYARRSGDRMAAGRIKATADILELKMTAA